MPRSTPSMLTVKRGLSAVSGISLSSTSKVRDQAGALAVHEQLLAEPGPEPFVELAGQVVELLVGVLRRAAGGTGGRRRSRRGGGAGRGRVGRLLRPLHGDLDRDV